MTYRYVEQGLAQMLSLSIDHILPTKTEDWKQHLDRGRLTAEMRDAFVALGWLSSSRDSRLHEQAPDVEPEEDDGEPVEIREPEVKPGKPETASDRPPKPPKMPPAREMG